MSLLRLTLIYFFSLLIQQAFSVDLIYVSPNWVCPSGSCAGTPTNPLNNLINAFQLATYSQSAQIILLYNSTSPDYYLISNTSSNTHLDFIFTNLVISPLLCNDNIVTTTPSLSTMCFQPQQKVRIILKTTQFSIRTNKTLTVKNIIFDALEDIKMWNDASWQLDDCLYNAKKCCQEGQEKSILPSIGALWCEWHKDSSRLPISASTYSMFAYVATNDNTSKSMTFENSEFVNFQSPYLQSLINVEHNVFTLLLNQTKVNRIYFDVGVISSNINSATLNSSILIQDSSFSNYNVWSILHPSGSLPKREGYLLYAQGILKGTFKAIRSTFLNSTSSLRNSCWPQTSSYYKLPMNNLLTSQPGSRTNLWKQYHQESYLNQNGEYVSSLIFIQKMEGEVIISDSTFQNIIGTSGSALRIDDVSAITTSFKISNTSFDSNFAYDRFANVMIVKSSDPAFSSILDCPRAEISKSNFTNTYGCPGAYGNVLVLCYLDSQPSEGSSLSSYSLGTKTSAFVSSLITSSTQEASEALYAIKVKDSLFQNNLLAVSNSLAIVGAHSTLFLRNTFQDNGGTTAEIAQVSLQGSYFRSRYPAAVTFPLPLTHFGQSSAVYLDRIIKIYSQSNIFQRNWGPWEGSMALGCSITIKNWLRMKDGLKFNQDSFIQHQGISSKLTSSLSNQNLKNNVYSDPIITVSVDVDASNALVSISNSFKSDGGPMNILLLGVKFQKNIASYDFGSITYNLNEVGSLIASTVSTSIRHQSGIIKQIMTSESRDDLSYGFKSDSDILNQAVISYIGGEISYNKLQTLACLFINIFFIDGVSIIENDIFLPGEFRTPDAPYDPSFFATLTIDNQGLLCVQTMDFVGSPTRLQLTANRLYARGNRGIIINLAAFVGVRSFLSNSIFTNNTCYSYGIVLIRAFGSLTAINNIFIKNYNTMGNIVTIIEPVLVMVFHVYLKNIGRQTSIAYIESDQGVPAVEASAKGYWNTIVWTYKIYYNDMISQCGIYTASFSKFIIINSEFKENYGYGGLANVPTQSSLSIYSSKIMDHSIQGLSIVGSFQFNSELIMKDTLISNSTLIKDPSLANTPTGILIFLSGSITLENVKIVNATVSNGAYLLFGNVLSGTSKNLTLQNVTTLDSNQMPLIYLSMSNLQITEFKCQHVTGLFNALGSSVGLSSVSIEDLVTDFGSKYLFSLFETTLTMTSFTYKASPKEVDSDPLISGDRNDLVLQNANFIGTNGGLYKIFSLTNSNKFILFNCLFQHNSDGAERTVFEVSSATSLLIEKCTFIFPGTILKATETKERLYFVENTIFTESLMQSFVLESSAVIYFLQNQLMKHGSNFTLSLPGSQVQITNLNSQLIFRNNVFSSLYGGNGVLELQFQKSPSQANITNNLFISNNGYSGGALYVKTQKNWTSQDVPQVLVQNTVFLLNKANNWGANPGKGGALYQTTLDQTLQSISVKESLFINNTADKSGGAIYFYYLPPTVDQNSKFIFNYAQRPNHISSYAVRIASYDTESSEPNASYVPGTKLLDVKYQQEFYKWEGIVSGLATATVRKYVLLDIFNQIVYDDDASLLEIYPDQFTQERRYLFSPTLSVQASGGIYTLKDYEFNYKVGDKLNVTFISSAVPTFSSSPVQGLSLVSSFKVEISFQICSFGQYVVINNDITGCQECPINFWQLNPTTAASSCDPCETDSTICLGGNNVGPKKGYWRMNKTADIVLACPRKQSCLGNEDLVQQGTSESRTLDPHGQCAPNYQGNLCYECISGWVRDNENNCINCQTDKGSYILIIVFLALQGLIITYAVRETIKLTTKDIKSPNNSSLFRIFINYTQTFYLLVQIPLGWPKVFTNVLGIISKTFVVWDNLFSVGCVYRDLGESFGMRPVFVESMFALLRPYFYIIFGSVFWIAFYRLNKQPLHNNKELVNNIITTIVIICFYTQVSVIEKSFSLFECTNLYRKDTPLSYFSHDFEVKCGEQEHLSWALGLAVPSLLIWVVALPFLAFFILRKKKRNLESLNIFKRFLFIYNSYKPRRYYWEFLMIARRILLVVVSVYVDLLSEKFQVFLFLVLIFVSLGLQVMFPPYFGREMNNVERASLTSLGIVSLCGLYFQIVVSAGSLDYIVTIAGVLGNIYFILSAGKIFLELQLETIKQDQDGAKLISFIRTKICCCFKTSQNPYIQGGVTPKSFMSEDGGDGGEGGEGGEGGDGGDASEAPKLSFMSEVEHDNQLENQEDNNSVVPNKFLKKILQMKNVKSPPGTPSKELIKHFDSFQSDK